MVQESAASLAGQVTMPGVSEKRKFSFGTP